MKEKSMRHEPSSSKDKLMKRFFLTLAFLAGLGFQPEKANADFYLVGAEVYSCQSDGTNGASGLDYRYSTNSSDSGTFTLAYSLNGGSSQQKGISFDLSTGLSSFTFTTGSIGVPVNPGIYGGLMLFFNTTGTSYNPNTGGAGIAGNLVVSAPTSGGSFSAPVAGTYVQDYSGPNGGYAVYSGATSFTVDGYTVNVSSFNINTTPTGSFTLNVVNSTPEPSSYALMALGVLCLAAGYGYRRRMAVVAA